MKPVGAYIAVNHGDALFSKLIQSVTAPGNPLLWWKRDLSQVPSHARLGVTYDDGTMLFWEALEGSKLGWQGPKPEAWAQEWVAAGKSRWTRLYDISHLIGFAEGAAELVRRAELRRGIWTYATRQNICLYLALRWGRPPPPRTPADVVCSEAVIRLLDGEPAMGEHPLMPRGWHTQEADVSTPYGLMLDCERLRLSRMSPLPAG